MTDKAKFGFCRNLAVILALLLVMLVSCSEDPVDPEKPNGTDTAPVSTDIATVATTSVIDSSASAENTADGTDNVILDGEEIPFSDEIPTTVAPDVTEEPSSDGAEENEVKDPAKTKKTDSASSTVKDTTTVTTKPQDDRADDTEVTTATPLIQVLPDGGILLPDDEWE